MICCRKWREIRHGRRTKGVSCLVLSCLVLLALIWLVLSCPALQRFFCCRKFVLVCPADALVFCVVLFVSFPRFSCRCIFLDSDENRWKMLENLWWKLEQNLLENCSMCEEYGKKWKMVLWPKMVFFLWTKKKLKSHFGPFGTKNGFFSGKKITFCGENHSLCFFQMTFSV